MLLAQYWPGPDAPVLIVRSFEGPYTGAVRRLPRLKVVDLKLPPGGLIATLHTPVRLAQATDTYSLDVVIAFLSAPSIAALRLLRQRVSTVCCIQNPPGSAADNAEYSDRLKQKVLRFANDLALSRVDGIISPTVRMAESLFSRPLLGQSLQRGNVTVGSIPNPLDPTLLTAPNRRVTPASLPTIVTAGRLAKQKRFDVFMRAIAEVQRVRPVKAKIFGEGPLRRELEQLAINLRLESVATIEPFQENLETVYGNASVFVLTSDYEGFGNVLVEALAYGLPVVSTDSPYGPAEILEGGRYGLLVPKGNPSRIAAAILSALPGGEQHSRLVAHARERARRFSAPEVATEMHQWVLEVVRQRRSAAGQSR